VAYVEEWGDGGETREALNALNIGEETRYAVNAHTRVMKTKPIRPPLMW